MEINVVNLKRYFGRVKAVDDISFSFASGNIFGFVGPNGAGKTTAMRIIATLDDPTDGDAFVDGISVVQDPEKARELVGFMPDSLPTHRDISVHEYLDFFARAYGVPAKRRKQVVEGIEDFTNLLGIRDKLLRALSKGMKQRVSLARAVIHDPKVLVLDEPAAGLDPRARVELRELLRALADQNKAILVSSHILTELSEICDGTVIIEQGKLLRAGTISEIMEQHDVPHRTVAIRTVGKREKLYRQLLQMPHVLNARMSAGGVEADIEGSDETCGKVLAELIGSGIDVTEFTHRRPGLEELFMNVTKGEVQ